MMEEWRVFTRRALETICEVYFEINFQTLSPLDMIDETNLRNILRVAFSAFDSNRLRDALIIAAISYKLAEKSVLDEIGEPALHFVPSFDSNSWNYNPWGGQGHRR